MMRAKASRSAAPWWRSIAALVIVAFAIVTFLATQVLSVGNMLVYDEVLLASFGAIALTVLTGTTGQVSIGNAAFLAVGAFGTVWAHRTGMPFPLDIIVATLISAVVGAIVGLPGVRLRGLELALATLSAFFIISYATSQYEIHTPGASAGFYVPILFSSGGFVTGQKYWAWLLFALLSLIAVGAVQLTRSKAGRAMRIIRDHELIAPTLGIPVVRYKLGIFAASSALIGLQGALNLYFIGSASSESFTLTLSIQYLAMVIIGGLGSIGGAIVGAAVVTALPTLMIKVLTPAMGAQNAAVNAPQIASIVYFGLLVVVVTFAPRGIAGWAEQSWHMVRAKVSRTPMPEPANGSTIPVLRRLLNGVTASTQERSSTPGLERSSNTPTSGS